MNLTQDNINAFLDKYIEFVNQISIENKYEANIKHLLYLIVPAFIYKYGINNETSIMECFRKIKIHTTDTKNGYVRATFNRTLKKENNNFYTEKYIVINDYSLTNLPPLIDNIIHEFNHAINSINNEVTYDDKYVYVRTGLSKTSYDKETLKQVSKSNEIALEEVLNTSQAEEIMNILNSFGNFKIDNYELESMLHALKNEIGTSYKSDAYQYQKYVCDELINNKTFTPTISNLRFKGFIEDIPNLFDDVIGKENSYKKLNSLLTEIHELVVKYSNAHLFKNRILSKIRSKSNDVIELIREYDKKTIFK